MSRALSTEEGVAKRVRVSVKADDIKYGAATMCKWCPIALAIKDIPSTNDVNVGVSIVRINDVPYQMPPRAIEFIAEFDLAAEENRKPRVKPFTFYLRKCK